MPDVQPACLENDWHDRRGGEGSLFINRIYIDGNDVTLIKAKNSIGRRDYMVTPGVHNLCISGYITFEKELSYSWPNQVLVQKTTFNFDWTCQDFVFESGKRYDIIIIDSKLFNLKCNDGNVQVGK